MGGKIGGLVFWVVLKKYVVLGEKGWFWLEKVDFIFIDEILNTGGEGVNDVCVRGLEGVGVKGGGLG